MWSLFYKERKNTYDLKQLKPGKYHTHVKLVCWDFFLTSLNLISLFLLNLIKFPNLHRVAIDGAPVGQNFCDMSTFFLRLQSWNERGNILMEKLNLASIRCIFLEWALRLKLSEHLAYSKLLTLLLSIVTFYFHHRQYPASIFMLGSVLKIAPPCFPILLGLPWWLICGKYGSLIFILIEMIFVPPSIAWFCAKTKITRWRVKITEKTESFYFQFLRSYQLSTLRMHCNSSFKILICTLQR